MGLEERDSLLMLEFTTRLIMVLTMSLHSLLISYYLGPERRQARSSRVIKLYEERKRERIIFWEVRSKSETAMVLSIAWYIQMSLIRSNQLPHQFSLSQLKRVSTLQKHVAHQAIRVYNEVYRDEKSSQFLVVDTGNVNLDGRIGTIVSYDERSRLFITNLRPTHRHATGSLTPLNITPDNMAPLSKLPWYKYNRDPKKDHIKVAMPNCFPGREGESFSFIFHSSIFQALTDTYKHPENHQKEALETMIALLTNKEEQEIEEREVIMKQKIELRKNMAVFLSTHLARQDHRNKRQRAHGPKPACTRTVQTSSVWKSKLEHLHTVMKQKEKLQNEHLFTYPFHIGSNSLFTSTKGMDEMNSLCLCPLNEDYEMVNCVGVEPIIVTTTAIQSIFPGVDLDDDAMDFCMQW